MNEGCYVVHVWLEQSRPETSGAMFLGDALAVVANATSAGIRAEIARLVPGDAAFGFTWDDVDAVKSAAGWAENEGDDDVAYSARLAAARIEALLPPADTTSP